MPGYVNTKMTQNNSLLQRVLNFDKFMTANDCADAVEYILKCSNTRCPREILLDTQLNVKKLKHDNYDHPNTIKSKL